MLNDMIDKLKEADGGVRVLDVEIHLAAIGNPVFGWKGPAMNPEPSTLREYLDAFRSVINEDDAIPAEVVPYYTSSLDGAVKLIPEGMFWIAGFGQAREDEPLGGASIAKPDDTLNPIGEAEAPTVPLAMCIAALEARLSLQQS